MRLLAMRIFGMALLTALLLIPLGVGAQKQPPTPPSAPVKPAKPSEVPDLADLMLRANGLSNRLAVLETEIAHGLDLNALEKDLQKIESRLSQYPPIIDQLEASPTINFDKINAYKDTIRLNIKDLEGITEPLTKAVRNLGLARRHWLAEKKHWHKWQSFLLTDETLDGLKTAFADAESTIDSALLLIDQQLQPLLTLLHKTGKINATINHLLAEFDSLVLQRRQALMGKETPPLFSWAYLSQLKSLTWFEMERAMQSIAWPKEEFYQTHGLLLVLQVLIALSIIFLIFRHRDRLMESERWRFIAQRPLATGLLLGTYPFFLSMKALPALIHLFYFVVDGLSVVRLLTGLIREYWKKLLLYALIVFLILTQFFYFINLPKILIQLYIFFAALVGLGLCVWRAVASARADSPLISWLFRLGAVLFFVVLLAEFRGNPIFAEYLLRAMLRTVGFIVLAYLLFYLVGGGIEVLIQSALLQKVPLVREHSQGIIHRSVRFMKVVIGGITLAMVLMVWGVYDNPLASIEGILSWGVTIGSQKITVGHVLTGAACLYGAFLLSWVLQGLLLQDKTTQQKVGHGGQRSLASLIHYALVFIGFLLAMMVLGIDLTKITIILGALGVGIGFGLQQIVNNFICGIILLVERPIRVGDYIELNNGQWAEIKRIGLRATRVLTFDRADVIIPNTDLITHQVINWTFTDRFARLKLPVGVAYGSDTAQVLDILMEVANEDNAVVQYPAPNAFFKGFGDSSLNFELRVYILNIDNYFRVFGRLYQEIERRLREAGITIPFPQRDLHIVSMDFDIFDRRAATEELAPKAKANPAEEESAT